MSKNDTHAAKPAHKNNAAKKPGTIDANPLGVLAGGLAAGAVAGALLPRSQREKDALRPVGAKLGALAVAAVAAAKEAGQSELETRGLTLDQAREQARGLFKDVGTVASKAGTAAVDATRKKPDEDATEQAAPAATPAPQAMADAGGDASGFNSGS